MKTFLTVAALLLAIAMMTAPAEAKGCIKGALVGASLAMSHITRIDVDCVTVWHGTPAPSKPMSGNKGLPPSFRASNQAATGRVAPTPPECIFGKSDWLLRVRSLLGCV
jgi:hypothetical protein